MRECWFLQLDVLLLEQDPITDNLWFKKKQCVDVHVFRQLRAAFLEYCMNPEEDFKFTVEKLTTLLYTSELQPRHSMNFTRALQILLGYYASSVPKGPVAELHGFSSATPVRTLTAAILVAALKRHFPVKVRDCCRNF